MKKKLFLSLMAAALVSGKVYPAALIVTEAAETYIKAETRTGYQYIIDNPAEDIENGDILSCIMFDTDFNGYIDNDFVINYRYSGFTSSNTK